MKTIRLTCAPNIEGLPIGQWETVRNAAGTEFQEMRATISSDRKVSGVRLSHKRNAVDLSRFDRPFPIHFNHDRGMFMGTGHSPRVENGDLNITIRRSVTLSESEQRQWHRVDAGELHSMSVWARFNPGSVQRAEDGTLEVTKWTPIEASVVTMPDDAGADIRRAFDELQGDSAAAPNAATEGVNAMSENDAGGGSTAQNVLNLERDAASRGRDDGVTEERERVRTINEMFSRPTLQSSRYIAMKDDLIAEGKTVQQAYDMLFDAYVGGEDTSGTSAQRTFTQRDAVIQAGEDVSEKWHEGVSAALAVRAGVEKDDKIKREIRQNEYHGLSVLELARSYLQMAGDTGRYNRETLTDMICKRSLPTHGSSDFPSVFANVANKAAIMGWDDAPRTWRAWCRIGNLTDFKPSLRLGLGGMSDLEQVPASGELPGLTQSDVGENIQLTTHGGYFGLNRQAIINDDLNEFADTGRKLGMAAGRVPQDLAYGILFNNPVLSQNGNAFFSVANNNIVNQLAPGTPSVDIMDEIELAMALQQGPPPGQGREGNDLNIEVATLVVPAKFKSSANKLARDTNVPGDAANPQLNIWAGRFEPVSEVKIDRAITDGTLAGDTYYAFANPAQWPAVEVAFLGGVDAPTIEEIPATSTILGMVWRVYLDVGAAALDYRPAVRVDIA